ncbi:MAG: hypothetical protein WKG07_23215 [Hymenobacter sp.]
MSALYFRLTPLTDAGSELLSRTEPTTWDVAHCAVWRGGRGHRPHAPRAWAT